jgi:hypothetical protein
MPRSGLAEKIFDISVYAKNLGNDRKIIQEPEVNTVFEAYTVRPRTVVSRSNCGSINAATGTVRIVISFGLPAYAGNDELREVEERTLSAVSRHVVVR